MTSLAEMVRTRWPHSTGMRGQIEPERVAGYAGIRTKKDDALLKWAKKQRELFCDLDEEQQTSVSAILAQFPKLIDTRRGRSGADPFVIALARVRGAVVVTGENDDGSVEKPKIPTVCREFGVRSIKVLEFIRENRWVFSHRGAE